MKIIVKGIKGQKERKRKRAAQGRLFRRAAARAKRAGLKTNCWEKALGLKGQKC